MYIFWNLHKKKRMHFFPQVLFVINTWNLLDTDNRSSVHFEEFLLSAITSKNVINFKDNYGKLSRLFG